MTPVNQAKKIVKDWLDDNNLPYSKLTARTISFSGFGYGSSIFVKIHGWKPNPRMDELKAICKQSSEPFCVETDGIFG